MNSEQLSLFEVEIEEKVLKGNPVELLPLNEYDHVLISLSGGKDSVACLLHLMEEGVPLSKIELWHQSVDGDPYDDFEFLDWPAAESYNNAVGELYGIPVTFQWRERGIYGEMMRREALTGAVHYVNESGEIVTLPTKSGKKNTRLKWPAMSADLSTRWCSAYAKIDVFKRVLNNHPKYQGTMEHPKKILVVTGERREESANRARYLKAQLHSTNSRSKVVHQYRPVIDWKEADIWRIFERHRLLPFPAYLLGWNRTSCFGCIFSTADLWTMMREIAPDRFYKLVQVEKEIGHTIDNKLTLEQKANMGSLDRLPKDARTSQWVTMALSRSITKSDLIVDKWDLPAGAFRGASGGSL
jgi:3'-phosphoadenosine 5'-phosphosulfate sulfotransferase (PAPS reductase)/FAD synthetase